MHRRSKAGGLLTTIDTIDGVIHVTNTGTPPQWGLTRVASIGPETLAAAEAGPEEFGSISTAAIGPGNEVFIGDRHYYEVRVFGPDGRHLRTFGRDGEGPGEFGDIASLAWVRDRLLALDLVVGRITEFLSDGEPLGQRKAPGREAPWDQRITCEYDGGWISFFEIESSTAFCPPKTSPTRNGNRPPSASRPSCATRRVPSASPGVPRGRPSSPTSTRYSSTQTAGCGSK